MKIKSLTHFHHFRSMIHNLSPGKWPRNAALNILHLTTFVVFSLLDLLDAVFCILFKHVDRFLEGDESECYCFGGSVEDDFDVSKSLVGRKNVFRRFGVFRVLRKNGVGCDEKKNVGIRGNRWSDCGCDVCLSFLKNVDHRLYVVTNDCSGDDESSKNPRENVIFIHGFLSSSSLWTETVFPFLSEPPVENNYKLFAIDLLGFGRSPKPRDCKYTLKDHLDMIDKSVILPFQLNSFHLVAHSMGCILALALAAKYSTNVKSITLIAPPYFPPSMENASLTALRRLAGKRLWPPLLFGSSVMTWYEHVGRCICFIVCRNHRTWEWIIKLLSRKRNVHFAVIDLTRHTHHSAWHTMHNVICGGAKFMDEYLEILNKAGVKINIIQGDRDQVVPIECSGNIKKRVPLAADVSIIRNCGHSNVILGREKLFCRDIEVIWASSPVSMAKEKRP